MSRLPAKTIWLAVGLMIISFNLRPAIVAVSPLLTEIQATFGLSGAGVGLLSTLPLLCFGLLAPLAPRLVHRFGSGVVLLGCLFTLLAGVLVRSLPTLAGLFLGTLLIGIGVAIANVLMPGILKEDFPGHIGIMTGLYTMMLSAGAAFAAGTTVPLYRVLGRNWHLASWLLGATRSVGDRSLAAVAHPRSSRAIGRATTSGQWTLAQFGGLVAHDLHGPAVSRVLRNRGLAAHNLSRSWHAERDRRISARAGQHCGNARCLCRTVDRPQDDRPTSRGGDWCRGHGARHCRATRGSPPPRRPLGGAVGVGDRVLRSVWLL